MSAYQPEEQPYHEPASRAAAIAAEQVESIIEAARAGADQLASAAQREADEIKAQARQSAQAELEAARRGAVRLGEEAREDAQARIAEAQAAADEVLEEAKAVSSGLRQLGHLLTTHAERILRDVQNSHRAISAELRAAGPGSRRTAGARAETVPPPREHTREPGSAPAGDANPFADLEPPNWVAEAGLTGRRRR